MSTIPSHVGIIMDGNGRWAKVRGKKRSYGHKVGSDNVERIVSYAYKKGVRTLSLYFFNGLRHNIKLRFMRQMTTAF